MFLLAEMETINTLDRFVGARVLIAYHSSLAPGTSMFINWSHTSDFTCGYRGLVFTVSVAYQAYAIILCNC